MLRIATYNILHGIHLESGGLVDLDAVTSSIAGLDADVVAIQEVDRGLERSGDVDQVAELAGRLGWQGMFAPALSGDPEQEWRSIEGDDPGGPAYGVGLLSPHALRDPQRLPLPGGDDGRRRRPATPGNPGWDREPRVALRACVETPEATLAVTTTHLSYLPWRGITQLRRAAAWARSAGPTRDRTDEPPAVLAGDLNLPAALVRALLRDWSHAGGPPTYPSARPRTQPDQIVVRGLGCDAVDAAPRSTSDHLPLVADLVLG